MGLAPGAKLGPYEIVGPLGAGGMGEVYRARDSRLGRDAALKVLPEEFAQNRQRMARFEREAKVLASLNHPGIAAIYGLEESNGVRALVMELVDGPTLAERLQQGPMALEESRSIAREIAEALEYAHERGIVHRDLKPANVKITHDGKVKILDFGLAKAMDDDPSAGDISTSPTISRMATQAGLLLGTAAYMSPEQARGKPVDRRADIWAFGVVLYEILTGKQLYAEETTSDTLAAVIRAEPDFSKLPAGTPPRLKLLLRRCLEKDPKQRLRDIGEARIVLEGSLNRAADEFTAEYGGERRDLHKNAGWIVAAICFVALLGVLGATIWRNRTTNEGATVRFDILPPERAALGAGTWPAVAVSPDGSEVVYRVWETNGTKLYLRDMASPTGKPIAGTNDATMPFFSPDGRWLAFFTPFELKRVSLSGGSGVTLADVSFSSIGGGTWSSDGNIYVAVSDALYRLPEAGGALQEVLNTRNEKEASVFARLQALPSGKAILATVGTIGKFEQARIVAVRTDTKEQRTLIEGGTDPHFLAPDRLVYMGRGTLMAVAFDPERVEIRGTPVAALEDVWDVALFGFGQFDVSPSGTIAYFSGGGGAEDKLFWRNRKGELQPVGLKPSIYQGPRLSPDGRQVALTIRGRDTEVWLYDLERGTLRRMTFGPGEDESPVWSPDGKRIAYSANGRQKAFWFPVDGSQPEEPLMSSRNHFHLTSWSQDGRFIAFESGNVGRFGIWILPLFGDRKPYPFVESPTHAYGAPAFSPDGKWLAYISNESGQGQIYVQRFPGPGERVQVSTDGGKYPAWSRDGRALFYLNGNMLMEASVVTTPAFSASKPRALFEARMQGAVHRDYDVSPDGKRFVVVEMGEDNGAKPIHVVLNWGTELRKRMPAKER